MRITYRTLSKLLDMLTEEQKDMDVTVEIASDYDTECYAAELRIAGSEHWASNGSLDENHPVVFINLDEEPGERLSDTVQIANLIGLV